MKDELRIKLKRSRGLFSGEERVDADGKIFENFFSEYGGYQSFFIYNSFGSEADTRRIVRRLINEGKKVLLPRVEGDIIVPVSYGETTVGAYGIEEPVGVPYQGDIDVIVAPLLAVNGRGYRIGYGKGYYDRFFKGSSALKVGLGYSFQSVEFDEDVWDEPLHEYLFERGVIRFGGERNK